MTTILVLSSYVAASPVGGTVAMQAGPMMGVETVLVPTVTFGQHPGLGAPGGGPVPDEAFASMLSAVMENRHPKPCDAVLTGYFSSAAQVRAAAGLLELISLLPMDIPIIVDPIMGDVETGLYVKPEVAKAIITDLAPHASVLVPNLWELGHGWAGGETPQSPDDIIAAARRTGTDVLATSVATGDEVGAMLTTSNDSWLATARRIDGAAPRGTGDLLAFSFTAGLADGLDMPSAMARAVGLTQAMTRRAIDQGLRDLPILEAGDLFRAAPTVQARRLTD